jgi:hypothetical protein
MENVTHGVAMKGQGYFRLDFCRVLHPGIYVWGTILNAKCDPLDF